MNEILNDQYEDDRSLSLSARDQYEREVNWIETEPLSPEEEKKYLDRILRARRDPSNKWLQSLAKDARERLTEHYQPLIRSVVVAYARSFRGFDFLDLVQEANMILLQAFDTCPFEPEKTFVSWAMACIHTKLRAFFWKSGPIRFCTRITEGIIGIERVSKRYVQEFGRSPSLDELSSELGLSLSRLYELFHYRSLRSFGSVEEICGRSEVPKDHCDFQGIYRQFTEEERVRSDEIAARVERVYSQLTPRQREMFQLRYGLFGESCHEAEEVSVLMGVKRGTVHRAVCDAKKRLRTLLAPLYEDQEVCA